MVDRRRAEPEYRASRNDSLGFARRTLQNLNRIEEARQAGDDVHVVTQRVVSLLGLVAYPWEEGFDQSIKSQRLDTLAQDGWRAMRTYPHIILFPGLAIFLTILAFNFLGNGLRDILDPKNK